MSASHEQGPKPLTDTDLDDRPTLSRRLAAMRQACALQPMRTNRVTHLTGVVMPRHTPNLTAMMPTTRRTPSVLPSIPPRPAKRVTAVPVLQASRRFPVASIDFSRRDVALPYGIPRFINAATLKRIAGGSTWDQLLKKTASGWKFVSNDTRIDLTDGSQEFRIGTLTIFS